MPIIILAAKSACWPPAATAWQSAPWPGGSRLWHISGVTFAPFGCDDPAPTPEQALLQKERLQAVVRAVSGLSDRDRALFYRKYYYYQSTAQMAAELGLTERAVEGRLYRIRKRLQKELGGDDHD